MTLKEKLLGEVKLFIKDMEKDSLSLQNLFVDDMIMLLTNYKRQINRAQVIEPIDD